VGEEFEFGAVVFFDLQNGLKLALWPRKSLAHDAGIAETQASATELSIDIPRYSGDTIPIYRKIGIVSPEFPDPVEYTNKLSLFSIVPLYCPSWKWSVPPYNSETEGTPWSSIASITPRKRKLPSCAGI
jgi:hypothetical protein